MFYRNKLLYSFSSLEPFIDAPTMKEHYEVHFKKYTDNLNEAVEIENIKSESITDILKNYTKYSTKVRNNGGGYLNHILYFENISPVNIDYSQSSSDLQNLISRDFGSYDSFFTQFKKAGKEVFGSGWTWLIKDKKGLSIATTKNQDNPIMSLDCNVLLGMDVWEHAYYLKHKADRSSYIDDFFRVINWKVVSERL